MRSRLFALVVVLLGLSLTPTAPAIAQTDIRPGIRGGVTSMTWGGNPVSPVIGRRQGRTFGVFATIDPAGPIAVRPEINYVEKGTNRRALGPADGIVSRTYEVSYLEGAILTEVTFSPETVVSPSLFAGPALGKELARLDQSEFWGQQTEFSLLVGGGVDLRIDEGKIAALSLDARYQLGMTLHNDRFGMRSASGTYRNQGVLVTLGVTFQGKPVGE